MSLLSCGIVIILFNVAVLLGWVSASAALLVLSVCSFLLEILLLVLLLFELRFSSHSLSEYNMVEGISGVEKNSSAEL